LASLYMIGVASYYVRTFARGKEEMKRPSER
jgi:hypothetical protein